MELKEVIRNSDGSFSDMKGKKLQLDDFAKPVRVVTTHVHSSSGKPTWWSVTEDGKTIARVEDYDPLGYQGHEFSDHDLLGAKLVAGKTVAEVLYKLFGENIRIIYD